MTLAEKVGQMTLVDVSALQNRSDIQKYCLGAVLSGADSDPTPDNRPETWAKAVNADLGYALKTRLKIPLLYGIDAVHGNNNIDGAVIFPHNIGLGAMHNPELVQEAEHITALETAGTGIRWAFAPCVAVARDDRWGRTYESFGQSPKLVSILGAAAVHGLQGPELSADSDSVLACAKHFASDGGTQDGVNEGNTVCDEATFRKLYLEPYDAAIKAGVGSIMVSFSSWNGVKMSANKYLLTDMLKHEMGFQGFLVSDWAAIDQLSPDYKKDIEESINAGMDMVMIPYGPGHDNNYIDFIRNFEELVTAGKIPMSRVDDAVRRILRIKFKMGLFQNPYTDPALINSIGSPQHRKVARECVEQSLVLLKNSNHVLPLSKHLKHLVVAGEAADNLGIQCGGWTISWQGGRGNITRGGTTILVAIRQAVSPQTKVTFSPNGNDMQNADAIIVVIGELPYAETEGDRTHLNLSASHLALVEAAKATGASVVTVLLSGRPLVLGSGLTDSDAFVAAWLPGTEGEGVADILFGNAKPSGKLPRVWPENDAQLSADHLDGNPLFPSGFGLTY